MNRDAAFEPVLHQALAHALSYLQRLPHSPVRATISRNDLLAKLRRPCPEHGIEPTAVIDQLVSDISDGILNSTGGRFFGWVIGGVLPSAMAADWLTSAWDQNAVLYAVSPALSAVEEVCGQWLKELLELPADSTFALVTGCQLAHVTCLAAARNALLRDRGWDVERHGLAGAPRIEVLTSAARHGSSVRALRLLGLGSECITELAVDASGQVLVDDLCGKLKSKHESPIIVLLQAGEINTGLFDRFEELIPIARKFNAWVHIDGAFGLWARTSPKFRHLLEGAELADSWTTDGHKWLNVPYDCGYAFVRDERAHRESMSQRASYLVHDPVARDEMDWTPEWSRRGRALATYAAIRELGRTGIANIVETSCDWAAELVDRIGELPGAEIVWKPIINQGLVRFVSSRPGAGDHDHDQRTDDVIERIAKSGEAFFTGTRFNAKRCMRISVCNWRTNEDDVQRAVAAVRQAIRD